MDAGRFRSVPRCSKTERIARRNSCSSRIQTEETRRLGAVRGSIAISSETQSSSSFSKLVSSSRSASSSAASCSGSSSANHSSSCTWVLMPSDGGIPDGRWRFRSPESGWVYGCTKDDGNVYVSGRVRGTSSSSARSAHTLTSGDSSSGTRKRDAYDRSHGPGPTRWNGHVGAADVVCICARHCRWGASATWPSASTLYGKGPGSSSWDSSADLACIDPVATEHSASFCELASMRIDMCEQIRGSSFGCEDPEGWSVCGA